MRERELIVYRNFEDGGLLRDMASLMECLACGAGGEKTEELFYGCVHRLVELAERCGFRGDLWHCYLAYLLANHENSFSCGCEGRGRVSGSIRDAVLHDMAIFGEFFDCSLTKIYRQLAAQDAGLTHCHAPGDGQGGSYDQRICALVEHYTPADGRGRIYSEEICARICDLAENLGRARTPEERKDTLETFYGACGVGKFGLHKSFRMLHGEHGVRIEPIPDAARTVFSDLVGYERQKKKLTDNTDAFVAGRKANNCLLYGDAGTGKSSCIKAVANEYYEKGLRVIEVYKHQFRDLNEVIAQVRQRGYKFIIYMDDLSFEDSETEYKYLKALIEGGLAEKPENVLIYATSNRRHLIRENYHDREEVREDMHTGDTVQEKLSLAYRFGVTIYFGPPDRKEFQNIVQELAERDGIGMTREELLLQANRWELSHGGLSGRTARQFVDYLQGNSSARPHLTGISCLHE